MYEGSLEATTNAADWVDAIEFTDVETGEPVDMSGLSAEIELRATDGTLLVAGSTLDGTITISADRLEWFFSVSRMVSVRPGVHIVNGRLTDPVSGEVSALFKLDIQIMEGGFK
jgi:hypothetical protein